MHSGWYQGIPLLTSAGRACSPPPPAHFASLHPHTDSKRNHRLKKQKIPTLLPLHLVIHIVQRELGLQAGVSDSFALMQRGLSSCCSQHRDTQNKGLPQNRGFLSFPHQEKGRAGGRRVFNAMNAEIISQESSPLPVPAQGKATLLSTQSSPGPTDGLSRCSRSLS